MSNRKPSTHRGKKALRRVARQEGISVKEVRDSMQEAILEAYHSTDPIAKEYWAKSPFAGQVPTPEEFIVWVSSLLHEQHPEFWENETFFA